MLFPASSTRHLYSSRHWQPVDSGRFSLRSSAVTKSRKASWSARTSSRWFCLQPFRSGRSSLASASASSLAKSLMQRLLAYGATSSLKTSTILRSELTSSSKSMNLKRSYGECSAYRGLASVRRKLRRFSNRLTWTEPARYLLLSSLSSPRGPSQLPRIEASSPTMSTT